MNVMTKNIAYQKTMLKNGQKVNYVRQGYGEPVILIHGLAASLHDWDDMLPELERKGYAGYALDLLGHGESEKPVFSHEYTLENAFLHFEHWLDALHLREPLTLVGHSLGGGLALMYALRHPQRVRALTLINPFYSVSQLPLILRKVFRHQLINTALIERTPYNVFRFLVDMTSFNYYIGRRESHILPEHVRYQTALDYKRAASGIYNIPRTLPRAEFDLSRLHQPTLLLWGGRDQTLSPSSFDQLARSLPNLVASKQFHICGHVPHQCHPERLNPVVMEFLRTI